MYRKDPSLIHAVEAPTIIANDDDSVLMRVDTFKITFSDILLTAAKQGDCRIASQLV